jgi:hypothetical protein
MVPAGASAFALPPLLLRPDSLPPTDSARRLYQTFKELAMVPAEVLANVQMFAGSDYDYHFLSDTEAEAYLASAFRPEVLHRFREIARGSHRADLLRYALLFDTGGAYLDIDTVLVAPLQSVFGSPTTTAFTALSTKKRNLFQAVLAAPPRHPVMGRLLEHAVFTPIEQINCEDPGRRTDGGCRRGECTACVSVFTRYFFDELGRHLGREPSPGLVTGQHKSTPIAWELFQEECDDTNATHCGGSFDRYGHCCLVRRKQDGSIVFLSRNPNFQQTEFTQGGGGEMSAGAESR